MDALNYFQRQWSQWRRSVLMILRVHLLSVIRSFRHLLDRCRDMCARLWSNNRDVKDYLPQRSPGQCQAMEWWSSSTSPRLITCFFRHPKDLPAIHVNTQKRFFQASKVCQTQTGGQIRAFAWDWYRLTIICCWRTESVSLIHFVGNQNYSL